MRIPPNTHLQVIRSIQDTTTSKNALGEVVKDDTAPYGVQDLEGYPIPGRIIYKRAGTYFDVSGNRIFYDELLLVEARYPLNLDDVILPDIDNVQRRVVGKIARTTLSGKIHHYEYALVVQP